MKAGRHPRLFDAAKACQCRRYRNINRRLWLRAEEIRKLAIAHAQRHMPEILHFQHFTEQGNEGAANLMANQDIRRILTGRPTARSIAPTNCRPSKSQKPPYDRRRRGKFARTIQQPSDRLGHVRQIGPLMPGMRCGGVLDAAHRFARPHQHLRKPVVLCIRPEKSPARTISTGTPRIDAIFSRRSISTRSAPLRVNGCCGLSSFSSGKASGPKL